MKDDRPRLFSYVLVYDAGFAPNPFFGWCTLACCKPRIRRVAEVGDIIVGTSSTVGGREHRSVSGSGSGSGAGREPRFVYAMRVTEIMGFESYWEDPRFEGKKPSLQKTKQHFSGDNIYHRDPNTEEWIQEDSLHSHADGSRNEKHVKRDTGTTTRVLLSDDFVYWGKKGKMIPSRFQRIVKSGQGRKSDFPERVVQDFASWFDGIQNRGRQGEPALTVDHPSEGKGGCCCTCKEIEERARRYEGAE